MSTFFYLNSLRLLVNEGNGNGNWCHWCHILFGFHGDDDVVLPYLRRCLFICDRLGKSPWENLEQDISIFPAVRLSSVLSLHSPFCHPLTFHPAASPWGCALRFCTRELQITTSPTYAKLCWLRVLKSRQRYANEHESCERSEGKGLAREKERGKNTECEPSGEKSTAQKHTLIIFLLCAAHLNLFQLLHTLKSFAVLSFPVCENLPTQSILIFAVYSAEGLFFFSFYFFLLPNGRERK